MLKREVIPLLVVFAGLTALELANGTSLSENHHNICSEVVCRPGRTCEVLDNGLPSCQCIKHCPDHIKPVCGSNGVSYENHCLLHKDACLSQIHISIKHKGHCKKEKSRRGKHASRPVVCLQHDRDHLRKHFIESLESQVKTHHNYAFVLSRAFVRCDDNRDNMLNAAEMLNCLKMNYTVYREWKGDKDDLVGSLCADAMVEVGDQDADWSLSKKEFQVFMDPAYRPPIKQCPLDDGYHNDGEEVRVGCNRCVCAGGNWTCVASRCVSRSHDRKKGHLRSKNKHHISRQEWERILQELNHN
ncbi:follistatin-related protein 1-like [Ornithodoros turicata]|uniref:follistatin-related protein 1-like n=1 Tax=Ornithodoros turicata TaxID=34597 RepID=UPI0031396C8B